MLLRLTAADWKAARRVNRVTGRWNATPWNGHRPGSLVGWRVTCERLDGGRYAVVVELREAEAPAGSQRVRFGPLIGFGRRPRKPR